MTKPLLKPDYINKNALKEYLDAMVERYNSPKFIESDPIQIPHRFTQKEDIEIAGFLAATIAWGNRKSIINSADRMLSYLDNDPFSFVMHHDESDLKSLEKFVHRTFNGGDFIQFIKSLKHLYHKYNGIEAIFSKHATENSLQEAIHHFKSSFFEASTSQRTFKHIGDPLKNSAAKRINMYLRWMVRKDNKGVDLGIWKQLSPSQLSCPLDVHSGAVARKLGLLERKQNDAKAVIELDTALRNLDRDDPVKYDFALFGLGVFEKF